MKTIVFISAILIIGIIFLISYLKFKFNKPSYPEYYKDVLITFKFPGEKFAHTKRAWLSVNDNLEYIWTLSNSNLIIDNSWVTSWKYLK